MLFLHTYFFCSKEETSGQRSKHNLKFMSAILENTILLWLETNLPCFISFQYNNIFGSYALLLIVMVWLRLATKAPHGHPSPRRGAEENGKKQAENQWVGIRAF